jgi:hypothetical protein
LVTMLIGKGISAIMWKGEKVIFRRRGNGGPGEGEEVRIVLEWVTETLDNSQYSTRLIPESRSLTDFNRLCGTCFKCISFKRKTISHD